jgi:hypothetical protein
MVKGLKVKRSQGLKVFQGTGLRFKVQTTCLLLHLGFYDF